MTERTITREALAEALHTTFPAWEGIVVSRNAERLFAALPIEAEPDELLFIDDDGREMRRGKVSQPDPEPTEESRA